MRVLLGVLLVVCCGVVQAAGVLSGRVVGVTDGDTVTVLDLNRVQHRIRLAGIDAPEKGQAFSNRSKEALAHMVFQRQVEVHWTKRDRYGRIVGKLVVDGSDTGLVLVQSGLAWWYRAFARDQAPEDRVLYEVAEREAREARRGLWAHSDAVAPWEYRRVRR